MVLYMICILLIMVLYIYDMFDIINYGTIYDMFDIINYGTMYDM